MTEGGWQTAGGQGQRIEPSFEDPEGTRKML